MLSGNEDFDLVKLNLWISGDEHKVVGQRLSHKHPVKRVSMIIRQASSKASIDMGDGKRLEIISSYVKDGIINL